MMSDRAAARWGLLLLLLLVNVAAVSAGVALALLVAGRWSDALDWAVVGAAALASLIALVGVLSWLEHRRQRGTRLGIQTPRYTYTRGMEYDEEKAVAGARAARLRTSRGRLYRPGGDDAA